MSRRTSALAGAVGLAVFATVLASPALAKWPPWLSIESPVNPYIPDTRGAVVLVRASSAEGVPKVSDVSGTAEGLVNKVRRTVPLRLDTTRSPGVFAVRRQWPDDGTWLLRISFHSTTAIVALESNQVVSIRVPTRRSGQDELPRAVADREIDSTLATLTRQPR